MAHDVHTGHGATLWFAEEATYGDGASPNRGLRLISLDLKGRRKTETVPDLGYYGQASSNSRESYPTMEEIGGSLAWNLAYDNASLILLKHLLGAVAEGGGGGPSYTHTFTLAHLDGLGLNCHAISGRAGAGSSKVAETLAGCKLAGGSIKIEHGKLVVCQANVIGKSTSGLVVVSSPTVAASPTLMRHNHIGNIVWNGSTRRVKSMTINVQRSVEPDYYLGSLNTNEPVETDLAVEIDITTRWRDDVWDDGHLADTLSNATFTLTSGALSAAFTLDNAQVIDVGRPVSARGAIEQSVKLRTHADSGGDQGLKIVVTNGNSVYSVN